MDAAELSSLPQECLLTVLAHLAVKDILAVACTCRELAQLCRDPALWRSLAESKWGASAIELNEQRALEMDWKQFCCRRISFVAIRPSPLQLIQEQFPDPWQHIICCVLCSRTSGSALIHATIRAFFAACPTPSAALQAPPAALKQLLHPLGLQDVRATAVERISTDFLAKDWSDPSEFYGCGKFTSDSWRIFCRGQLSARGVQDVSLKHYLAWANRRPGQQAAGAVEGGGSRQQHKGKQTQRKGSSSRDQASAVASKAAGKRKRVHGDAGADAAVRSSARLSKGGRDQQGGGRRLTRATAAAAAS